MTRNSIQPIPPHYGEYINKVEGNVPLLEALKKYHVGYFQAEYKLLKSLGDRSYAQSKWTVKEVLQHVVDSERIFAYRALRIARNDQTPLPGYDQEVLAATANASLRTVGEILREFELVRESNIMMFETFNEQMLLREGNCNNVKMSALALGFVIVGHAIHHMEVIREKYFPLLEDLSK